MVGTQLTPVAATRHISGGSSNPRQLRGSRVRSATARRAASTCGGSSDLSTGAVDGVERHGCLLPALGRGGMKPGGTRAAYRLP
jgi:hypothetical protein